MEGFVNVATAFGLVLRNVRKRENLTQEQLALQCGYQRNYISLMERGHNQPTLETLLSLASALHCDPADLVLETVRVLKSGSVSA
jgi:transcriptional regulator with XRE-family HTH domain